MPVISLLVNWTLNQDLNVSLTLHEAHKSINYTPCAQITDTTKQSHYKSQQAFTNIYIFNNYKLKLCKLPHIVISENHRHYHHVFDDLKKIWMCIIMHTNATIWGISCSLSLKVKYVIYMSLVTLNRIGKMNIHNRLSMFQLFRPSSFVDQVHQ